MPMNKPTDDKLSVHVNVQITAAALQSIVSNAKQIAARDANGSYRIDTADQVSIMITRFLDEKDFETHVKDIDNYKALH
jgi:protein involved in polysaccharide export with SLBB domain